MRLGWPGSSTIIETQNSSHPHPRAPPQGIQSATPNPAPKSLRNKPKKHPTEKHTGRKQRSGGPDRHKVVLRAAKRKSKKEQINRAEYSFVYVGNIESSVSVARLEALFLPCGPIARTQMRCSRGQAITVGLAVPDVVKTERDRQYATIEFKDAGAARKALRFNGRLLDQSRLVVTISPADLPEVQDIVRARLVQLQAQGPRVPTPPLNRHRPLSVEQAEQLPGSASPPKAANRHRIFGISFAKCLV